MKKKVIVAGHICLDITPVFPDKRVINLEEILTPGKLIHTGEADVHTGGAVANTGLAMKILGAEASLVGKIGNDAFGDLVRNILRKYEAEAGLITAEGETTSYSIILAIPGNDRIFLHNPGANDTFYASDIPQELVNEAVLFHFGYPTIMKSMYDNEGEELVSMMKRMKEAGVATSLDMSAVDMNSEAGQIDWKKILERALPYVDFFVPSVEELCFMLDKERFGHWQNRANGRDVTEIITIENDVKPLAKQCMELGAKVLLIKCGAPGIYYCTAGSKALHRVGAKLKLDYNRWSYKEGFEKSYVPEKVLSGTGTGDTSIAAFLTAMLEGCSIEEALQLAAATGASCVAAYDALSGLRSLDDLRVRIRNGWKKIK